MCGVFELRVLGPLEVVVDGAAVPLPGRKHPRLLAALTVADGHSCSIEALTDAVWGETPPRSARKLLQLYVSQLRKVVPEGAIRTTESGYALDVIGGSIDAERFELLAREAEGALASGNPALTTSLARRALALWRGPAYADVMYEDFVRADAERLEELRLGVTEDRLDAQLRLGRHKAVLARYWRWPPSTRCANDSRGWRWWRSTVRVARPKPWTTMRTFVANSTGSWGSSPGRSCELCNSGSSARIPSSTRPARQTVSRAHSPSPVTGWSDVRRAGTASRDPDTPGVAPPRAHRCRRQRQDPARVRSCSPSGDLVRQRRGDRRAGALHDPALVAATIAQALDVAEVAGDGSEESLARVLADRELLLVLDNAEHLLDAAPLFARLVSRAPRLTVVVTRRAVLHISGEQVFPVAPLPGGRRRRAIRAAGAPPRLVVRDQRCERAGCPRDLPSPRRVAPGNRVGRCANPDADAAGDRRAAGETARTVDVGPSRPSCAPADLARDDRMERRAALGPRAAHLPASRRLPGGATLEAAEAVCGADVDTIEALVNCHVVRRIDVNGAPRFGLLETIREYAADQLVETGDRDTVRRHAEWCVELAETAEPELSGDQQAHWFATLEAEHDNLRAALEYLDATRKDPSSCGSSRH